MSELSPQERTQIRLIIESHQAMERSIADLVASSQAMALEHGMVVGKIDNVAEGIGDIKEHLRELNGKVAGHEREIHACEVERTIIKSKVMVDDTPVNQALRDVRTEWRVWGIVGGMVFAAALAVVGAHVFGG